jgi:hypothetical protein
MGNCKSYPDPNPVGTNTINTDLLKGEHFCAIDNFLPLLIIASEGLFQTVISGGAAGIYLATIIGSGQAEHGLFPGESTVVNAINKANIFGLNDSRVNYCSRIADDNEWQYNNTGDSCKYNSCHSTKEFPSAICCKACCPIEGRGVNCKRVKYVGNPFVCCMNDYALSTDETDAFQTPAKMRTCDPDYRDLGKKTCRDMVFDFCAGNIVLEGQDSFRDAWAGTVGVNIPFERGDTYPMNIKQPCVNALYRGLYGDKSLSFSKDNIATNNLNYQDYDIEGLIWAKKLMKAVIENYTKEYSGLFNSIDQDGIKDQDMYNTIQGICQKDPALCSDSLKNVCSGFDQKTLLENAQSIIPWCGCYLPDAQYQKYTDLYGINKECTPFCSLPNVIPAVDDIGAPSYCTQNICIMDDISVTLANVYFNQNNGNALTFNQMCSSCGKSSVVNVIKNDTSIETNTDNESIQTRGGILKTSTTTKNRNVLNTVTDSYFSAQSDININRCDCRISNNINIQNSSLNSINYLQNCGNLNCYNENGKTDCVSKTNDTNTTEGTTPDTPKTMDKTTKNTLIILAVLFIIFIIFFFFFKK